MNLRLLTVLVPYAFSLFLGNAVVVINAAPMSTCSRQGDCIDVTYQKITPADACSEDYSCEYRICLKIKLGGDCVRKKGSISHVCKKPDDQCMDEEGFGPADIVEDGLRDGYEQCQIVPEGKTASFLLKDGNGCSKNGGGIWDKGKIGGLSAYCEPRGETQQWSGDMDSCTEDEKGEECIWFVRAPSCEDAGDSTGTGPDSTTPSPTDVPTLTPTTASDGAASKVLGEPGIALEKTVSLGVREGKTCNPGTEEVMDVYDTPVTYTYVIKNTGKTCLNDVVLTDASLNYQLTIPEIMPIGKEYNKCFQTSIKGTLKGDATVTGNPVDCSTKLDLPDVDDVSHKDSAGVKVLATKENCTTERETTQLDNGQFIITSTDTCKTCTCP